MTSRKSTQAEIRSVLTELESEVMNAVWELEPCSVEQVHDRVSRRRDLKETSVRTILRRLEMKGYLTHKSEATAYIYRSVEPSRSLAARAVRQIIDRFCRGSVEELVSGMVDAKVLSGPELERIEKLIRTHRKRGK